MNVLPLFVHSISIKLAISVKANFGDAKVTPELKQAAFLRGHKV